MTTLKVKEDGSSSELARRHIAALESFEASKLKMGDTDLPTLRATGNEVRGSKYETPHSSWVYESPAELTNRETAVDTMWAELGVAYVTWIGSVEF